MYMYMYIYEHVHAHVPVHAHVHSAKNIAISWSSLLLTCAVIDRQYRQPVEVAVCVRAVAAEQDVERAVRTLDVIQKENRRFVAG